MANAIAMIVRSARHQQIGVTHAEVWCHWCPTPAAEVVDGKPCCYVCAQDIVVERLWRAERTRRED